MPDLMTPPVPAEAVPVAVEPPPDEQPLDPKAIETVFKSRMEASKRNRRKFSPDWKRNIELRIGKIATVNTDGLPIGADDLQSEINPDWALTKTKTANLYSQVPAVQGTHENTQYAAAVPPFMKQLNYELGEKRMNVGVAMEEVLNDVVNASGIGAVIVGYAARFETVPMPATDPLLGGPPPPAVPGTVLGLRGGPAPALGSSPALPPPPMIPTQRVVSDKFFGVRISPSNLLWPAEFIGSNFDEGDFLGYSGKTSWPEAKNEWHLREEDREKIVSSEESPTQDDLRSEPDRPAVAEAKRVSFDELYYWRYRVDPNEKSFSAIWKLVFVHGLEQSVVHEPWTGQQYDEASRKYIGACKFPIRVLTLTYITDNPIPPSDSAAGRPQVNDLRRSRSQMFQNRERSIPMRGFDVNRVDPAIQDLIQRGVYQGWIPFNGNAQNAMWEVARASYPAEDMSFDVATKADLMETWQIGPNQLGTTQPGKKTSAEVNITQQGFATRIGQERARVANFFLSICEVLAGLMVLYSEFPVLTDQERQAMQQAWDQKHILHDLVLKIRPDSTIVLDSQARIQRLVQVLNFTAKSGVVDVVPIVAEIHELSGLDPAVTIIKPQPKPPEEPSLSFSFGGKEDLINPLVMALLVMLKKAPTPEALDQAKQILLAATQPPQPPPHPGLPPGPAGAGGPAGAPGPHTSGPGGSPGPEVPSPAEGAHPDWHLADKIAKRTRDGAPGA